MVINMELYPFQQNALDAVASHDRCAFYHEMGLGKTFTGSEKLMSFGNNTNLVVCQKSKVSDWVEHFKAHYPDVATFDLTAAKQSDNFREFAGRKVGIINYDLLFRRPWLGSLRNIAAIFDESSMIKNEASKRTKCALGLSLKQVVLLSGTPVGGKYEELWTQCHLLGWSISKDAFWDQYIRFREWQPAPYAKAVKLVTGYKNVTELKMMLSLYGAHFLKSNEVLTLPDQVFQTIRVPSSHKYANFIRDGLITVQDVDLVGDTPLKKMLYARELCSIYSPAKIEAFQDVLNSTNDRLIVFYNFNGELTELQKAAAGRPISVVNGHRKDLNCYENCDNSVTFVQYQAGALGLNLQKANRIVYFSLPLSSDLFEQSKKRTHRLGQTHTCFYYTLLCSDSIEEKILSVLNERREYTLELFKHDGY